MATYTELAQLYSVGTLREIVRVAVVDAALTIIGEDQGTANHAARYVWAAKAIASPDGEATRFLMGILVANKAATVAQIQSATDSAVQSNVDALVDAFALADAG